MDWNKQKVKCKKDLFDNDGQQFTKGNYYIGNKANILEAMKVTNDSGNLHRLGNWSKHFKIV